MPQETGARILTASVRHHKASAEAHKPGVAYFGLLLALRTLLRLPLNRREQCRLQVRARAPRAH